jgi:hypothetical protein
MEPIGCCDGPLSWLVLARGDELPQKYTAHCDRSVGGVYDDPRGGEVREGRPVDAGDVVDVGPTPVMRAVIGLAVGLVIGAVLALLLPRGGVRRR